MRFSAVLTFIAIAGLLTAVVLLALETRSLAAEAGRLELEARSVAESAQEAAAAAADELQVATVARDELTGQLAAARADVVRLEGEVARTATQLGEMSAAVERAQGLAQEHNDAIRAANERALAPMPAGVRQCLATLHECLRIEGFPRLRFLRARALDDEGLHGVELVHAHGDELGADLILADRMTATLDRPARRLELTFFEGTRSEDGERVPLPEDGFTILVGPVEGPLFETRLPQLVTAEGEYPKPEGREPDRRATDLDPASRLAWLDRFDGLLAAGGTAETIRLQRLRGLEDGSFLEAQLLATDSKGHVLWGATCARLAVEVDETANIVSLVLRDGLLRRGLAESNISADGYRILLPKVTPARAIELMLGLVVRARR